MESIFTAAALAVLIILAGAAPGVQAQDEIETANGNSSASPAPVTGNVPIVVYAEGGTVDDFAATVLLGEMHKQGIINFVGDIVENGDSVLPSSIVVAQKFHVLANITDVPTLLSQTNAYNPFPWGYRTDSLEITTLPEYQEIPCDECTFQDLDNAMDFPNGEDFLKEVLQNAEDGSITYLVTAAMSNIAAVLRENPELESKVKEILWMGGAVNVPGNLLDPTVSSELTIWNDKAEWNVYSDPFAAAYIFENTSIPILMFPLDISDQVRSRCHPHCHPSPHPDLRSLTPFLTSLSCSFAQTPVNGTFMDSLNATVSGLGASPPTDMDKLMYAMYDQIAAPQPFYRLWNEVAAAYMSPALQK